MWASWDWKKRESSWSSWWQNRAWRSLTSCPPNPGTALDPVAVLMGPDWTLAHLLCLSCHPNYIIISISYLSWFELILKIKQPKVTWIIHKHHNLLVYNYTEEIFLLILDYLFLSLLLTIINRLWWTSLCIEPHVCLCVWLCVWHLFLVKIATARTCASKAINTNFPFILKTRVNGR